MAKGTFFRWANFGIVLSILITAVAAIFFTSCASTSDYSESEKSATSSYTFYDYRDGDKVQYKVYFNDDEISALYIDGKKIPDQEVSDYENMIYDRIENVYNSSERYSHRSNTHFDMDWLRDMMTGINENLQKNKIRVHINKEDLEDEMERLKDELDDIDIDINFDKKKFREEMKQLKKELRRLKDKDFTIDMEEFNKSMQKFSENMKDQKFAMRDFKVNIPRIHIPHIDIPEMPDIPQIPEINIDMSGLEESMKELDKNMAELKVELKKVDSFIDDFKEELLKEGKIKSRDEGFELNSTEDGLELNGEKLPDHLFNKYKELYKKHFGKEYESNSRFRIHN